MCALGIFTDPLELGVRLGSKATLSCDSQYLTDVGFQKLTNGSIPVNITRNSSNHLLLINHSHVTLKTTLTFLKFRQADAGVYRCKGIIKYPGGVSIARTSEEMTVFILNGIG